MERTSDGKVKLELQDMAKSFRDASPAHYTFKIQSFSLLLGNSISKYESRVFESGGYKWKLLFYPKGNPKMNVQDHLSLYLVMDGAEALRPGFEVNVTFKLFLFDQIRDRFLTVEDNGRPIKRFHVLKTEWGFSKFVPLATFNDPSNGYLVNDTCVFGAEVFVCNSTGQGECFSMLDPPTASRVTWNVKGFSSLTSESLYSEYVSADEHKWSILLYPKGSDVESRNSHISVFLQFKDLAAQSVEKIYAKFIIRVREQQRLGQYHDRQSTCWFTSLRRGWPKFMELSVLKSFSRDYLLNDTLVIEADVTILGIVKRFT